MFCYNNYLYSLYKSINAKKDSGVPKWELHDVIMRHLLHYLETNKRYKHQENIKIAKKIDICTARFALKENEMTHGHNLASQANTSAERVAIAKQRMESCKKIC